MLRGVAALSFVVGLLPACDSGKCGSGTIRYGDTCVLADPFDKTPPVLTIDPPLYTRTVGTVHITSDKPATIYYTLDGNPPTTNSKSGADEVVIPNVPDAGAVLRAFAIDLAGNKSDEVVRVWVIDHDGPGAPLDFHLALGTDQATRMLTWGMPPDPRPGGVLVARIDGRLGPGPVSGQAYQVGDSLGAGMTVVAIGGTDPNGMFSEVMAAGPGLVRYVGWAFDSLDNYGPPAVDYAIVPMAAQTATVNVDKTTGTVTVANAPSTLGLFGNASISSGNLSLNLSVKNTTSRTLFAPKLELTSTLPLPGGVTWSDPDGTIGTTPYRAYGGALNPDASNTETFTFSGVSGSGTLSLTFAFRDDKVLSMSSRDSGPPIVDSATGVDVVDMPPGVPGKGPSSRVNAAVITPEGNMITAQRESCKVISYNIGTGREVAATSLCAELGHVAWLVADHGGSVVYAVVSDERPKQRYHTAAVNTQLVRLDATTLAEYGPRISLGMSLTRSMQISPDDKTLIIATAVTAQGIYVIDTTKFQIARQIVPDFKVQAAALAPDGQSLAAVGDSTIGFYDLGGDLLWKPPAPGTPTTGQENRMMAVYSSPTMLWISRINEVDSLDLKTGNARTFNLYGGFVQAFDGKIYTHATRSDVSRLDVDGNQEATMQGLATNGTGHWVGRSPF
jgi:hypothetical protein